MRRIRIIGIGAGHLDQVTVQAIEAMRSVAYFVVADKGIDDPLLAAREALLARHLDEVPTVVAVADPKRDRHDPADYRGAVTNWHDARAAAYEQVMLEREGDVGFLVWGDPAFYDSTIRIVEKVLARGNVAADWDVLPGISSVQMLAARHRIVLHEIGQPITVTTARRFRAAVASGADNIVVMLGADPDLSGLGDWYIWWGANLGTPDERLISGRVRDVGADLRVQRAVIREATGWIMDTYLLRR